MKNERTWQPPPSKARAAAAGLLLFSFLVPNVSFADIPQLIQYQGKATDKAGMPISGTHEITFRIYDAVTDGSMEWEETHTAVPIENGLFSVLLGGVTPLDPPFDKPYWLSMEIDSDGEMMPRHRLTSVPYAYAAERAADSDTVDSYHTTDILAAAGKIVQVVYTQTGEPSTGTTIIPGDHTIPENTEGDEYMTATITPTAATSTLKIDVVFVGGHRYSSLLVVALFQDEGLYALACGFHFFGTDGEASTIKFTHYMTAGTKSPTTFKVRAGSNLAGLTRFNDYGIASYGGVLASSITIMEIRP